MKNKGKFSNQAPKKNSRLIIVLCCIAVALVLLIIGMIAVIKMREPVPTEPTTIPTTQAPTTEPTTAPTETTVPTEPEYVMMAHMEELYNENPDFAGWIKIADTKLDNHVMHTPEDEEKYLRADFNGQYSVAGLPFIAKDCSLDPTDESDNIILYGHNMTNGTMFHSVIEYASQKFWEEHPVIEFSTLYETREYEVIAAFYDRVYYKYEDVFKFYQFIDAETEEEFNEAIAYYKEHSEYDTGLTAEYGDRLLTLVTCSYHHKYGRFVVIARQSMPKEVPAETVGE
jgi:sortase B